MFNETEKQLITDALDMALKSNARAEKTSKTPEFRELYRKLEAEIITLRDKIKTLKK